MTTWHLQADMSHTAIVALLLLTWLAVAAAGFRFARQSRLLVLMRTALLVLLVLAAAGPVASQVKQAPLSFSFLLDASNSVSDDERKSFFEVINQVGGQLKAGDQGRLIIFGRSAQVIRDGEGAFQFDQQGFSLDGTRTNLATALRTAVFRSSKDSQHRILLFTDGNQNLDDASTMLSLVRESQAQVFTFSPREKRERSLGLPYFDKISMPRQVGTDERFHIHVFLENPSDKTAQGTLRLRFDQQVIAEHRLKLPPGMSPFRIVHHELRTGIHCVSAELQLADRNEVSGFTEVGFVHAISKPKVLLVDRDAPRREFLANLLKKNFAVEGRIALPASFEALMRYECIILNDVPTSEFRRGEMETISRVVQDTGTGLIVIGGDSVEGLSSYRKSRIEDVMPVRLDLHTSKDRKDFALILVIDKSGSMAGKKIEMARRAAIRAVENLEPGDVVGVLAFDARQTWLVPIVTLEENKRPIKEMINGLGPGGGTDAKLALQKVFEGLLHKQMNIKQHVVLISDGITQAGGMPNLVSQMSQMGITVSIIAIGQQANLALLHRLKQAGKGEFYHVTDIEKLPNIVLEDLEDKLGEANIIRSEFQPRIFKQHPIVKGIDETALPVLKSYSVSELKPSAHKPLTTNFKNTEDPVVATWLYGLGKCSAVLSGLRTGWMGEGTTWKQFGTLWSQLVRWTARSDSLDHPYLKLSMSGDLLRFHIRVPGIEKDLPHSVRARFAIPGKPPREIPLQQKNPYEYLGEIRVEQSGEIPLVIDGHRASGPWVNAYPLFIPEPASERELPVESSHEPPNIDLLRQLATATGGRHQPEIHELLRRGEPVEDLKEYWSYLVVCAMLLFLTEVAVRRFKS